ncbi:MAG: DUF1961 family protein [Verrucomicrobiota bacterium]
MKHSNLLLSAAAVFCLVVPVWPGAAEDQRGTASKKRVKASLVAPSVSLDEILEEVKLETIYETAFDGPLKMLPITDLLDERGKQIVSEPPEDIDWILEGPAEISVKEGRMHMKNDPSGNCVLWNTRIFPDSFVAEWDFQHLHPQGTALFFFAAYPAGGGSIYSPGLPPRRGNFGHYTRGSIFSYHTSYSATDEEGVPRGSIHLKKNVCDKEKGNNTGVEGLSPIDGRTDKPFHLRLAKLENRLILEIDGKVYFDWTDEGVNGLPAFGGGQIGFRQMRHTLEGSYGSLSVKAVKSLEKQEPSGN